MLFAPALQPLPDPHCAVFCMQGFQKLTLGELPIELEGLRVVESGSGKRLGQSYGTHPDMLDGWRILGANISITPIIHPTILLDESSSRGRQCSTSAHACCRACECAPLSSCSPSTGRKLSTRRHRTPAAATASVSCTVGSDRVEFEVDFRWIGEPSISFFVELALAGCAQSAHP